MRPPVKAVIEAHVRLLAVVRTLDDGQVAAPSVLPSWSRGHVLAHLTDNARMFARLAERAALGEVVPTYDGGQQERDAIIEATAARTAGEHLAHLADQVTRLEKIWAGTPDEGWSRPVSFRDADVAATVHARWREVWIHLVDLDLGVRPADWPADLAAHVIDFLFGRLPAGTSLVAEDAGRKWVADGSGAVVAGRVRDLAAWLAGREPEISPTSASGLPALGPWPPHPPGRG